MNRLLALLTFASLSACAEPQSASLPDAPPPPRLQPEDRVCPADVQECKDGSFVARDPQNHCKFKPCPEEKPK